MVEKCKAKFIKEIFVVTQGKIVNIFQKLGNDSLPCSFFKNKIKIKYVMTSRTSSEEGNLISTQNAPLQLFLWAVNE